MTYDTRRFNAMLPKLSTEYTLKANWILSISNYATIKDIFNNNVTVDVDNFFRSG